MGWREAWAGMLRLILKLQVLVLLTTHACTRVVNDLLIVGVHICRVSGVPVIDHCRLVSDLLIVAV